MEQCFVLSTGLIGLFDIAKLWREIKTSEDKCIARLKITASTFGLEYLETLADCHLLEDPDNILAKKC